MLKITTIQLQIENIFNIYNVLFRTFFSFKTNENLTNKKYIYKIEIYKPQKKIFLHDRLYQTIIIGGVNENN